MAESDPPCAHWELVDLFCGGGLFSFGARFAGMRVAEAVDCCPNALSVYKLNFDARVSCATLGPGRTDFTFPEPHARLHLHLSPPCQELSNAKSGVRSNCGVEMLKWSVEAGSKYDSFSVETVFTGQTQAIAKELAAAQPDRVAFGVYDSQNFSTPQTRVRLIISTPQIIRCMNEAPASAHVSVEEAFRAAGVPIPAGATHLKNSSPITDGTKIRPIQGASFTCCASRALSWCSKSATTIKSMVPADTRVLMGCSSLKLSGKQRIDQRVLGNGVCFGLARAVALAAMGKPILPLIALTHTHPEAPRKRPPDSGTEERCFCDELETRLMRVERRLSQLKKRSRSA
jgi:hypothetical protein